MKRLAGFLAIVLACSTSAATNHNDHSCDIAVAPAATLLLPHFEVNLDDPHGVTTIFNVTNVSPEDRIARVTLWTDYAYPALTFNIPLAAVAEEPQGRTTPITTDLMLPPTSLTSVTNGWVYPALPNGATSGWMYLNLNREGIGPAATSNWVVSSMRAEGRYSIDVEAVALGNGCSPAVPTSEVTNGTTTIGPRP
jgi:hypothetical protein